MPSPEQIEKAIAKVKPSHATFFVMEKDLSSKQLRNVRVFFPELYTYTKVVALLDTTLMKSGKEGFLLTQGSLHIHKLRDQVVSLLSIQKATASGSDVTITYSNGTTAQFYASIYAEDICAFLNALGPVERHKEEPKAAVPQKEAPRSAPQPEPAAAPQPNPVVKAEPKPEPKSEPKPQSKPVVKAEPKPEPKPQSKPVVKAEPKPEPKPQSKPTVPGQTEFEKGVEAMKQGREQEAIPLFEIAADKNIISAMYNLSLLYGWKKDYASAFDWMLKAARKGYKQAYTPLSRMYLAGLGTQRDLFAAQYWARMAVQNGDSAAQPLLAQTDGNWRDFLRSMEVGKRFEFGTYPQTEDGQLKPIIWRVLDKQADKMLVLSEYVLDRQTFNEDYSSGKSFWANCTLRKWLHEEFWNMAFQEVDTTRILSTKIHTVTHPDYDLMVKSLPANADKPSRITIICPETVDRIFIPSWDEIIRYLCNGKLPMLQSSGFCDGQKEISASDLHWYNFESYETAAPATPYVAKKTPKGILSDGQEAYKRFGTGDWWLRNMTARKEILYVYCGDDGFTDGLLSMGCNLVIGGPSKRPNYTNPKPGSIMKKWEISEHGVRPAMWIDLR